MALNKQRAQYFENTSHSSIDAFFYTVDNMAFFKESDAVGHADGIRRNQGGSDVVEQIARAEYNAWKEGGSVEGEQGAEVPAMLDVVVTQQILDDNPDLVTQGVQVGETIQVPVDDTQTTPEEIKEDVKAAVKKGTAKKSAGGKKSTGKKK